MVKLTTKYLFRKISKKNQLQPRRKNETDLDYLNRVTHLHLESDFIDKIGPIPECESVRVVYLQNNLLQKIQNLENFPRLTHLYLQHNYITKLENLSGLTCLKKLYLGWNEITVIEGLEGLSNLTELHLENQRLPSGETLYFDPSTIFHLSLNLKVLNISNDNMSSMVTLKGLTSLRKLLIDGNRIEDLGDFAEGLSCMSDLEELSCTGNPVTSNRRYLDEIILAAKRLKILNGKPINDQTRLFITNMSDNREYRRMISELSTKAIDSEESVFSHCRGDEVRASPRIGSKLFPVLKEMAKNNQPVIKVNPLNSSTNSLSPVFRNSLKISCLSTSTSFYY